MKRTFVLGAFFALFAIFATGAFAQSTTLVLSQVYGGGGGSTGTYLNDYVEIKNISSSPQSLNGLSVYYGSATGQFASSASNAFALPDVTLSPGQFFLVQLGSAGTAGAPLPVTPDATTTNLSMSATNGKVALVNGLAANTCGGSATPCTLPNAQIVDLVSYGTANNAEGGVAVNNGASLSSTQGAVRKGNGCTDTDNNNNDFDVITAPVPRNSSTTAACSAVANTQHVLDYDGDGKTDRVVVRNIGGVPNGQVRWFINTTGNGSTVASDWGLSNDFFVSGDFDGDQKSDIAVWRQISSGQPSGNAYFYVLNSSNSTVVIEDFGQLGDDPTVVGDYNGDGKTDFAVYRAGAASGDQSTWFFRTTPGGPINYQPWGSNGDFPAPGDYDGDGKNDFVVQRNNGGGQGAFWMKQTTAGNDIVVFGTPTDVIVPGDYDGDGKTDIAVRRSIGGALNWFVRPSSTGVVSAAPWAIFGASATDFTAQGDYDGDGKTDVAVWRSTGEFWINGSTSGAFSVPFGANGDYPVANFNSH